MPNPLRVAVIGLGAVAVSRHLPILINHPHFQIHAAAELDNERAQTVARQFSISNIAADARAVIESDAVDVVAIFTPPFTHAALAHYALDAGKHLLIEKPLTINPNEAEQLAAHAERASTKLLMGFNQRHHPHLVRARALLRAGQLGAIRAVSTFLSNTHTRDSLTAWHHDPARGGDLLYELGVHHFDALRFLLDADVAEIHAHEFCSPRGALTNTIQMRLTNNVLATTTLIEDALEHNEYEIVGERGKLNLSLYRFDGFHFMPRGTYDGSFGLRFSDARKTVAMLPHALPRIRRGGEYTLTYRAEWDHFYEVIQNNAAPLVTVHDGVAATRLAHTARESITRQASIFLPSHESTPSRAAA